MTSPTTAFIGISLEGGLLPPSLLELVAAGSKDLKGSCPEDYHLAAAELLGDAASRKWLYLRGVYKSFRDRLAKLLETDPATSETRENWLLVLLSELGFGRVPFIRGGLDARDKTGADKTYPVSHQWEHVPIHLVGWHTNLDKRPTQHGRAPQSMLQEFLNVSEKHLWGLLSNGRQLRLLRDSNLLVGSSYVEFDLEAIFDGELYSDFFLLFALLHESRFELLPREDEGPPTLADCWLERWRVDANEAGVRARDHLRDGVQKALEELGTGFLEVNPAIRQDLASGALDRYDFRHELLRLAYQLIFLFVTEDRGVLHDPDATLDAKESYRDYFSTARLRRIARVRRGDRHTDLWQTQVIVLNALGADGGEPVLGLPGLGGLFFRPDIPTEPGRLSPDLLRDSQLRNDHLLAAVRHLDEITDDKGRPQRVDYEHLGAEELGSVYESLLELDPQPDTVAYTFVLEELRGNARKTTGSYYTPRALVETLLDSTVAPILDEVARRGIPADLLKLTVCDPACGSGAFLVATARRIATKYAAMVLGDEEPSPHAVTDAMHEVVRHCVYGVDINPLAVELAQVSLWMESQAPGKPLAFLDNHIKPGNSLLGVTPRLLEDGIPNGAFKPIEGDDSKVAASLRKQNEKETGHWIQGTVDDFPTIRVSNVKLAEQARRLAAKPIKSLASIREQVREFQEFEKSPDLRHHKQVANAWCAAFVWRKHGDAPEALTSEPLRRFDAGKPLLADVGEELDGLTQQYQFFHWHLEFPEIFRVGDDSATDHNPATGWEGGFTFVVGNPPWERVKLQEQEFFATRRPDIAKARNAATRKKMIDQLGVSGDPVDLRLYSEFHQALRRSDGWSQLLRESERYPLTGHGDINTYAVFAETARTVVAPTGRSGLVLPTGIGTDATTAPFFRDVVEESALAGFLEFENEAFLLSRAVHHSFRFCLLTMCGRAATVDEADFAFGIRYIADLEDRRLRRPPKDLLLVNPNTGTTPLFRFPRDASITFGIYRNMPVLWQDEPEENPWDISFMAMFHMANDSGLFKTEEELCGDGWKPFGNVFVKDGKRMLPLYEAKMIHHFDHRYGTFTGRTEAQAKMGTLPRLTHDEKSDPGYLVTPQYWVQEFSTRNDRKSTSGKDVYDAGVTARLASKDWTHNWLLGWRDTGRGTDERTFICSLFPAVAVSNKLPVAVAGGKTFLLAANFSSFVFDYVVRQKIPGATLNFFFVKQFPVLAPERFDESVPWEPRSSLAEWIEQRVFELTYTAWDMAPFAQDLGDNSPPFVWDDDRRFKIRAELDAAFFHLYKIIRADVDYIMETFPVVRERDEKHFNGDYRTKSLILQIYDAMAEAEDNGVPYRSVLDPLPGHGRRHPATDGRLRVDPQEQDSAKAVEEALASRSDLDIYADNKRLLFAVQLRMDIDDIDGLAAEALTDGADDKASDLIHVDRDAGIILLAQGTEYATERAAARQTKAATLHQAVTWVFSHTTDDTPERLLPRVAEVRAALADGVIRELWVWFVHNLPESENVRRELIAIQSAVDAAIRAGYPETILDIRVDEIGRDTLAKWYESSRTPILVTDEITVPVDDSCLTIKGPGWTAYTVTVTAEWLNNAYWKYEEKLFSANVRGFLGARNSKGNINNGMRETLEGEPGNFWVFNNGITALVDDARYNVDDKELLIRGLSIVNGAQTTGAVAKFKEPDALPDARIVMRFIKCGDSAIVQKIIRFNNRQNVIDPADFRSNDRAQRRLVDEFKALGIEGYTGGRRGRGVDEVRKPIGAVDVASASRALAAYHGQPGVAYNERRLIWEDDRLYRHLFSEDTSAHHVLFCWSLIKAVEDCKARLRGLEGDLIKGKKEQREYFEHPGSIPLLVSAIAESMDAILDRPIANSFQPKFKGRPGPAKCMEYWRPIVDALAPFANRHLKPVLKASGPPRELSKGALQDFRNLVESWIESGDERCKTFADKVELN